LKKNPPIKDSQDSLRARLCDAEGVRRLFVNPDTAPTVDKGLQQVKLKKGSSFQEEEEYFQHVTSALRYFTYKVYGHSGGMAMVSLAR
jgi:hypothetical protein